MNFRAVLYLTLERPGFFWLVYKWVKLRGEVGAVCLTIPFAAHL